MDYTKQLECLSSCRNRLGVLTLTVCTLLTVASPSVMAETLRPGQIPDLPVLDQDGNPHRFFTDLIKGKIVAINFVYTTCAAQCPRQAQRFGQLQTPLASILGKNIFLLTITTDPANDTPAKLKAWAAQYGAKPGWTFVTGDPLNVKKILNAFIALPPATDSQHTPVVVMINEPLSQMKYEFSLSPPAFLYSLLTTWNTGAISSTAAKKN